MSIHTFKGFRSRNYRLYFSGQSVSLMGTWMQRTAVYWIIYVQTHSAFMLGVAVFAIQFPSFLFSLLGGTVADRYNKYRVLLITQIASMVQAVLLTLLVLFTRYTVAEILTLSILLGIINAFDVPARQSMVHDMVQKKEDLGNAIALNSSMNNIARLIGPAVSGIVLDTFGAGICFMINAMSFVAVIATLLMMRLPVYIPQMQTKKVLEGLQEGLRYLKSTPSIGMIVLLMALSSLLVMPYITLFPVIAKITLNGNASTYGFLNSFTGIGAIGGAIFLASLNTHINLKKVLVIATIILGIGLILFSYTDSLVLALLFAAIAGFGMMSQNTLINTLLQTTSSIEMRGRVISYYAMAAYGMNPIGALFIGSVSYYAGTPATILSQGIAAVLIALLFFPYLWKNVLPSGSKVQSQKAK
jgi:MFS family permease